MVKKIIRYTSRDFETIREDLESYVRKYYPDTYKDFNKASFGALVLDLISYLGDVESFNLDYNVNESFLDTSLEFDNIIKLGIENGYKFKSGSSSYGTIALYLIVPASVNGQLDSSYVPILLKGSQFSSQVGNFILTEDVNFNSQNREVVIGTIDPVTELPTTFVIKVFGNIVSGDMFTESFTIGSYQKFLKLQLAKQGVAEIVSVKDSDGRQYYEVDHLSQNLIYRTIPNTGNDSDEVASVIKPMVAARRFVSEQDRLGNTIIRFGYGSIDEEDGVNIDPSNVLLERDARDYMSDSITSFDPGKINYSDKFGIVPTNTIITVEYRVSPTFANVSVGGVNKVLRTTWRFVDESSLNSSTVRSVKNSLDVANEEIISGATTRPTIDELKENIKNYFATQKRAVTSQDYKTFIYSMPKQFGSVKRCNIIQDSDSFKRNLNLYILSEDNNGYLTSSSSTLKDNIKTWLLQNKMVNDTIDILDAKIINIGIDYTIIAETTGNKFSLIENCNKALQSFYSVKQDIGQNFNIMDVYSVLKNVEGVADVVTVKVVKKEGSNYSSVQFNVNKNMSADQRTIICPQNAIFEIKYLTQDIRGMLK